MGGGGEWDQPACIFCQGTQLFEEGISFLNPQERRLTLVQGQMEGEGLFEQAEVCWSRSAALYNSMSSAFRHLLQRLFLPIPLPWENSGLPAHGICCCDHSCGAALIPSKAGNLLETL